MANTGWRLPLMLALARAYLQTGIEFSADGVLGR